MYLAFRDDEVTLDSPSFAIPEAFLQVELVLLRDLLDFVSEDISIHGKSHFKIVVFACMTNNDSLLAIILLGVDDLDSCITPVFRDSVIVNELLEVIGRLRIRLGFGVWLWLWLGIGLWLRLWGR